LVDKKTTTLIDIFMPIDPNNYTSLNIGESGSIRDATAVEYGDVAPVSNPYPLAPGAPVYRRRARTVVTGQNLEEITSVKNANLIGDEYGLVIKNSIRAFDNPVNEFDSAPSVNPNSLTTVTTYTVPSSTLFVFLGIKVSGDVAAKYTVNVNATTFYSLRTTATNLDGFLYFNIPPFELSASDVITIKVIYYNSSNPSMACDFEGTILGFEIPT
jgi:hypothetical protein